MDNAALEKLFTQGGVLRLSEPLNVIYSAAENVNYWRIALNCKGASSKNAMLTRFADTLQFPDYFGMNLDALYDCLTEQLLGKGKSGAVLILQNAGEVPTEVLDPIIDTLLDAHDFLKIRKFSLSIVKQ